MQGSKRRDTATGDKVGHGSHRSGLRPRAFQRHGPHITIPSTKSSRWGPAAGIGGAAFGGPTSDPVTKSSMSRLVQDRSRPRQKTSSARKAGLSGSISAKPCWAETRRRLEIPLVQGTAQSLPFSDGSIDFLVMGYAIRHISDLETCFREFSRVLKPGGTVLVLEVSQPISAVYRLTLTRYLGWVVPRLSHWITRQRNVRKLMAYHWRTMETCVAPRTILDALENAGFTKLICETWFDLFRSYSGRKPLLHDHTDC